MKHKAHTSGLTCIHRQRGLCSACRAEYEYDAQAYDDYCHHTEGLQRWAQLQAEIQHEAASSSTLRAPINLDDIPF